MAVKIKEGMQEPTLLQRQSNELTQRWWKMKPGNERARAIIAAVDAIEREQTSRRSLDMMHLQMYGAGNASGQGLGVTAKWRAAQKVTLRLNLAQMIVDSMQAKIAKLRPRPRILTTRGDWGLRKRAEAMEQMIDGEFYRNNVDDLGPKVATDSFAIGDGFGRVCRRNVGHPVIERALPGEVLVDYWDGLRGFPRCIYQTQLIDRDYLDQLMGGRRNSKVSQLIRDASGAKSTQYPWLQQRPGHSDMLYQIEAFHLPSYPDAGDGAYTLIVGDSELLEPKATKYERDTFPIAQLSWQPRTLGFYSKGLVEEITPQQIEVNYTLEKIQYMLHNVSTVRHWIQAGGKIELRVQKMTNTPGEVLKYFGPNPPITEVVNAVPRELFDHVINQKNLAFESVGLSQFFATASKPAGLDSGEAQRVYEDVGSERQMIKGRGYEGFHMQIAQRVVDVKHEIADDPNEKESPVVIEAKRKRGVTVRTLSYKDVNLEKYVYLWKTLPESALPGTPSGRAATASEWLQMGAISPDQWRDLMQMPDLASYDSPEASTRDNVLSAIEAIADDGEYVPPHSMLDIQLAKVLVAAAFNRLQWEGLPEDRLELIARYASELVDIEQAALEPQQPAQMMPGAMPGADAQTAALAAAGQGAPAQMPMPPQQ